MGQLERYGLYVLCLVIFLILGVALWGTGPGESRDNLAENRSEPQVTAPIKTPDEYLDEVADFTRRKTQGAIDRQKAAENALFNTATAKVAGEGAGARTPEAGKTPEVVTPPQPKDQPEQKLKPRTTPKQRVVEIRDGDTFTSLAIEHLGAERHFLLIQKANPRLDPRRLRKGDKVVIPALPSGRASSSRASSGRASSPGGTGVHRVAKGENPWTIARKLVGPKKAQAYAERMLRINNITDPTSIDVGDLLKLPPR